MLGLSKCAARKVPALIFSLILSHHVDAANQDQEASTLAKQNACLGCHAINKKIVGPSFSDVAKKYANDPNAVSFLQNKIRVGGAGSWGVVPMPANAKLRSSEIALLVGWILRGAPSAN